MSEPLTATPCVHCGKHANAKVGSQYVCDRCITKEHNA